MEKGLKELGISKSLEEVLNYKSEWPLHEMVDKSKIGAKER